MLPGRFVNESDDYRRAREELLAAEIALREQRERVAALRRQLPLDSLVEDYVFEEGPAELDKDGPFSKVRLSELFADQTKPLVVYQYMYGAAQKSPCPMCTLWVDGFKGVAHHLRQRVNLADIAQAGIVDLRRWGRQRGWHGLRLVSSADTDFKTVLKFQDSEGRQWPGVSVFVRSADGSVKHFYSASAIMKETKEGFNRGIDLLSPVWGILDLTPGGRGDWNAKLTYD
jgi:predicted dithiol-disulfide oxidoreductase (DUF899 family)